MPQHLLVGPRLALAIAHRCDRLRPAHRQCLGFVPLDQRSAAETLRRARLLLELAPDVPDLLGGLGDDVLEHQRQRPAIRRELVSGRLAGVESWCCHDDDTAPWEVEFFERPARADWLGGQSAKGVGTLSASAQRGPYSPKHAFTATRSSSVGPIAVQTGCASYPSLRRCLSISS